MAATGKKSKKIKGKTLDIKEFLGDVAVSMRNIPDDEDEYGDSGGYGHSRPRAPVVLPSASRASRGGNYEDENVPRFPPYIAYVSNLPYDVENANISEMFSKQKVINLRLPRELDGRLKGFGYVEFEDRESLVEAVNLADLQLSGRRVRIEVATADDRGGKYGNRRSDRDRDREYDPERTSGDWRDGPRGEIDRGGGERGGERGERREWSGSSFRRDERDGSDTGGSWRSAPPKDDAPGEPDRPFAGKESFGDRDRERGGGYGRDGSRFGRDGGGFGGDRDRGYGRDGERGGGFGRDGDRGGGFSRDGERGGGFGRDGDRGGGFGRDGERGGGFSRDGERGGGFSRDGDRGGGFGRDGDRGGGFGRDGERGGGYGGDRSYGNDRSFRRDDGGGFGRSFGGDRFGDRDNERDDRDAEVAGEPRTRRKLELLPRTVPLNTTPPASEGDRSAGDVRNNDNEHPVESSNDSSEDRTKSPLPVEKKSLSKPPVPASSIFGGAKPVDTSAREREIEERLMKKAEELKLRDGRSKDREETKWRDRKDDFEPGKGGIRRSDDRGSRMPYRARDSNEYPKDSRDFRDARDSRDYRDTRDYGGGRESRDRRDYKGSDGDRGSRGSKDNSRDVSKDNRESRDGRDSRSSKEGREISGSRDVKDSKERDAKEGKKEKSFEDRPMPKAKDHEPPNFIAQNKYSYLENADDDDDEASN